MVNCWHTKAKYCTREMDNERPSWCIVYHDSFSCEILILRRIGSFNPVWSCFLYFVSHDSLCSVDFRPHLNFPVFNIIFHLFDQNLHFLDLHFHIIVLLIAISWYIEICFQLLVDLTGFALHLLRNVLNHAHNFRH